MEKLIFQQLNFLCDSNVSEKYMLEILQILKNEDCIFIKGIIESRSHIASLYSLRYDMAKKENKKLTSEQLKDYENCVIKLKNSNANFAGITSVHSNLNSFLIFFEPDSKTIFGVLKSKSSTGIENLEDQEAENVKKGFSSNLEKYSKGCFVRILG